MASRTINGSYASFAITVDTYTLTNLGVIGGPSAALALTVSGTGDSVVNAGTISGTSVAVTASMGLYLTNQSGGKIDATPTGQGVDVSGAAGTVVNAGAIAGYANGVLLGSGGAVTNQLGGTIGQTGANSVNTYAGVAILGATARVNNSGAISGAVRGIYLGFGGTVTNQSGGTILGTSLYGVEIVGAAGTITNAGSIAGQNLGLLIVPGGTVTNQSGGRITGIGTFSTGLQFGGAVAGTVINAGSISGGDIGVALAAGGAVTNQSGGTISQSSTAAANASYSAVAIQGAAGTVTNAGYISSQSHGVRLLLGGGVTNQSGGTISGGAGVGVTISGGAGTVVNAGGISGGAGAVLFGGGVANRLIDDPGATFSGTVDGGNTVGSATVSMLELSAGELSAAAQGTLTGFGTEFINFAQVVVDPGASWTVAGSDTFAAGTTLIDEGALLLSGTTVDGAGTVEIGDVSGIPASVVVSAGGSWAGTSLFEVGGAGALSVNSAGSVSAAGVDVAGSSGSIAVTGTRSLLTNTGEFVVGDAGIGSLSIDAGGTVITSLGGLVIANTASGDGSSVNLSGAGSNFQVAGSLDAGLSGSGVLSLSDGSTITASSFDAGVGAAAVGQIGLSGSGTGLSIAGAATVADAGTGVLSVLSGATFSAASLTIGANKGSSGAVVVSGAGSDLVVSGVLNIGSALGAGDLTVGPSAAVHASVINLEGQVVLEGGLLDPSVTVINPNKSLGGSGTVASGDIIDEGILQAGDGTPGQLELVQGTIVGGGTLTENGSKVANKANAAGVLQINTFGTMEVDGAVLNAATTTFANDVTPTTTYTVTHSVIDVNFEDSTGVLQLDDIAGFGGTIATFQVGDEFIITGGTLSGLGVNNGTTLTMADSGNGGTDQIIFNSPVSASYFNIVNGNSVDVVACFAAGTRIETVDGPVAVERLRAGNRVVTNDGTCEPVVWIGSRVVNCAALPKPETVWPVRVSTAAFGPARPGRELYLSPDHAVFVNGVLVPVKLLVNGESIAQVERAAITYHHVELPRHAIILAEGLPVESYLDLGDRVNFGDGTTIRLFPDFAARLAPAAAIPWETKGAAPLVLAGAALEAARLAVAANTGRRLTKTHGN